MFLKKRWSLLSLKHRRQTAKFQFIELFFCGKTFKSVAHYT